MDRRALLALLTFLALGIAPVRAADDDDDDDDKSPLAEAHFPQPVQVGQLIGRDVLEPKESQPVLGRVRSVVRDADGGTSMVMNYGGWFGWGARPIAVPLAGMSLMGEYVAVTGYTPDQLKAFPTYRDGTGVALPQNDTVKVGLVKPFH